MGQSQYIIIIIISLFLKCITGSFSDPVVNVNGFVGESAVLLCDIEAHIKTGAFDVHWRDTKGNVVYDIIRGNGTVENQAQQYNNRVEKRDNCSIKLNNLSKTDEGKYTGYIADPINRPIYIYLTVTDKPEGEKGSDEGTYSDSADSSNITVKDNPEEKIIHGRRGELAPVAYFLMRFFISSILFFVFVIVSFL